MPLLHIALQEGFQDDTVIVRVNGQDVFHKPGVRTKLQIGRATAFDLDVEEGLARIEVIVPEKGLAGTTSVEISRPAYIGISLSAENSVTFQRSERPFGYV